MLKNIFKFSFYICFLAFFLVQSNINAQTTSSSKSTEDIRSLLSAHLHQTITNLMLMQYLKTSDENLTMFKEIQSSMTEHPNFNADQISNLIEGMETKLAQANLQGKDPKKKKE